MEKQVDVVIVGGGISGLTAAYHLHKKDPSLRVCVLEAKDRVGGRTLTVPLKSKNGTDYWDLGGQWVSTSQKDIMNLIKELGLETYPQYHSGRKFTQVESAKVKSSRTDVPPLSVFALADLSSLNSKLNKLGKEIDSNDPYRSKKAKELDSKSVHTLFKESLWTDGAFKFMEVAIRTAIGLEPSQMSALFFLSGVGSAGGVEAVFGMNESDAQGLKVKGGTQQISQIMANKVGIENVLLDHPVEDVTQDEKGIRIKCVNGVTVCCERAILAMPPTATSKISFNPPLSRERLEIERWIMKGNTTKVIITYQEAFWRSHGQSGEALTYGGPTDVAGCDVGPLSGVMDASTPSGNPALVMFVAADQAIQWSKQDAEVRKGAVLRSLTDIFGPEAENCLDYIEQDWSNEPFIDGAIAGVATGGMKYYASGLRQPQGRLHFAGTESAIDWSAYMSGGVQAGVRAATEILYHLRPDTISDQELLGTACVSSYRPKHN
ncbi:probable flavin-containing monoamine oxidase A [Argopecten irradians]|uniref:probable flavin-containing monoamine oxidase A n=1 Tax=Argopecten irradians TaxID=31199 RepID=UPI0037152CCF